MMLHVLEVTAMEARQQIRGAGVEMTDDERWQAVQSRESQFDGVFVYAVRSTGIYCRPSCPSRRPKREHIIFFPAAAAAGRHGEPCRMARLKVRLRAGEDVTSALYDAGYGSSSRLYEQAHAQLGMTPNA